MNFVIFASTTCKVSRFYEKLDMFILKKIDKKDTFYAAVSFMSSFACTQTQI